MRSKTEMIRNRYPVGTRVCCDEMPDDPNPIPRGTCGTVMGVDDAGQLIMKWDNGRSLSLIPGVDRFHVVEQNEDESLKENEGIDLSM
ncbi:MAG: DUF4314 domain-containing protein [Ruminococcus albus]|nr:DUF4314 domain-containing protein [Ruminococcus albus]